MLMMVLAFLWAAASAGAQVCDLVFQVCPKDLDGTVLEVPESVIWIEPRIPACQEKVRVQTGNNIKPTSVVFVIDNSGSMSWLDGTRGGSDEDMVRFSIVRDLMDSIYRVAPGTQVALVSFARRLSFDHRDNPYFERVFPDDPAFHDSYVPLTALNARLPNGVPGIDTLKAFLKYSGPGNLAYATQRTDVRIGTDITLAFQAAKKALERSPAAKEDRYVIFLSDGIPDQVEQARTALEKDYVKGESVPTTFGVYFMEKGAKIIEPKPDIATMIANIRANGYSQNNPKSDLWAVNLRTTTLMPLLQEKVLNPIFADLPTTPESATLRTDSLSIASGKADTGGFTFPARIPLARGQTQLQLNLTYAYQDSTGPKKKVVPYTIGIKRVPVQRDFPRGIDTSCLEPGAITLYSGGAQVHALDPTMRTLEARLRLPPGQDCQDCRLRLATWTGPSQDQETLGLQPATGSFAGSFDVDPTGPRRIGDGRIRFSRSDSLVLLYINPSNTLDTIRAAFPYSEPDLPKAIAAEAFDADEDGIADRLEIRYDRDVSLQPPLRATWQWPAESRPIPVPSAALATAHTQAGGFSLAINPNPVVTTLGKGLWTSIYPYLGRDSLQLIPIVDRIAPVLLRARMRNGILSDTLVLEFSEPIDVAAISAPSDELFRYRLSEGGQEAGYPPASIRWSGDRSKAELMFAAGAPFAPRAGNLVRIQPGPGRIRDDLGNAPGLNSRYRLITGEKRRDVETVTFRKIDPGYAAGTVAVAVSLQPPESRAVEVVGRLGTLGHLIKVDLGDYAVGDDFTRIDPASVILRYETHYFTNLGGAVASARGEIKCTDALYGGDCRKRRGNVFVGWNYTAENGQRVGTGAYVARLRYSLWVAGKRVGEGALDQIWGIIR
jgi:hypothetical protein